MTVLANILGTCKRVSAIKTEARKPPPPGGGASRRPRVMIVAACVESLECWCVLPATIIHDAFAMRKIILDGFASRGACGLALIKPRVDFALLKMRFGAANTS